MLNCAAKDCPIESKSGHRPLSAGRARPKEACAPMRWIDKLERRCGRCGIPYLLNIVLAGQLAVWFLVIFV